MAVRRLLYGALPQRFLSRLLGIGARCRAGALTTLAIRWYVRHYQVRLEEAAYPDPRDYSSVAEFFARPLRSGTRRWPSDATSVGSPADGVLTAFGPLEAARLVQAKNLKYSAAALLGDDAARYDGGAFATLYLRPQDYHRVHCPLAACLVSARYVPGRLWPARPWALVEVPALLERNERLSLHFEGRAGHFTLVMVGALFVGGLETTATGRVRRDRQAPRRWNFSAAPRRFTRGAEVGSFHFGSTVVLLFEPGMIRFNDELSVGAELRVGALIGRVRKAS